MKKLIVLSLLWLLITNAYAVDIKEEKEMFFDSMAKQWEEMSYSKEELGKIEKIVPLFGLQEGEVVLDAGCGTGRLIPFLLKAVGDRGHVYCLDFSQKMLEIAKQKKYSGSVSFAKSDITQMPLPSESLDRIICFCTFPHINNKMDALKEFFRVLKPGGVLIICNLLGSEELNAMHKKIGGAVADDISPGAKEVEGLFLESNFTPVELLDSRDLYLLKAKKMP